MSAQRRLQVLGQQLAPPEPAEAEAAGEVQLATVVRRQDTAGEASTSGGPAAQAAAPHYYASIDGRPNSYARTHGAVSRAPAIWRNVPVVAREELTDVKYEKAEGEGVAKVGRLRLRLWVGMCHGVPRVGG